MKQTQIEIRWKRFNRIPKKNRVLFAVALILCIYSFVQICLPMYRALDQLEEREIRIDSVYLESVPRGSLRLWILSGEEKYYVSYPKFRAYRELVEADLLSGQVDRVSVIVPTNQMFHDRICQRLRAAEIRQGETVYFGLEDEKSNLRGEYFGGWLLFLMALLFLLGLAAFDVLIYGLVTSRKKGKSKPVSDKHPKSKNGIEKPGKM